MWSILYNGHTVALPNSDDFYAIITDTTKMFTTNVDLPISEDLINIFNIKGLLTRENGAFFKKVTLPCTLQGFGVRIPCKISIESIKQKEGLLNLYMEAKSTIAYSPTEWGELDKDVWAGYHYPMIRKPDVLPYFWGGIVAPKFYHEADPVEYENQPVSHNLPYLTKANLESLLTRSGYPNVNLPNINVYPNQIYMNGRYKMRRIYAKSNVSSMGWGGGILYPDSWVIEDAVCYKGDYAGIGDDVVEQKFYVESPDVHNVLNDKFYVKTPTRNIYIFYKNRKAYSIGGSSLTSITEHFTITANNNFLLKLVHNGIPTLIQVNQIAPQTD